MNRHGEPSRLMVPAVWRARMRAAGLVSSSPTGDRVVVLRARLLLAVAGIWRWRQTRIAQLPEALERMAASLRSGASMLQALSETAAGADPPLGEELKRLAHEAGTGRGLLDTLDDWVSRRDDTATRLAACAMAVATTTGAAPARALDGVAATLRERLELARERRALATQARASAVVLSVAPVVFTVLLVISEPTAARFLLGTTAGWACLLVGLSLDAVGAVAMWRMTRGPR